MVPRNSSTQPNLQDVYVGFRRFLRLPIALLRKVASLLDEVGWLHRVETGLVYARHRRRRVVWP